MKITPLDILTKFMGPAQRAAVKAGLRGEERKFFADKLAELAATASAMPTTYESDGKPFKAALRYFAGGRAEWLISELDAGAEGDEPQDFQRQMFGRTDLFGDGGELGYISLAELLANAELDFHYHPKAEATMKTLYIERDPGTGHSPYKYFETDASGLNCDAAEGAINWDDRESVAQYEGLVAECDEVFEVDSIASLSGKERVKKP